jgi:hypothetical protein
MSELRSLLAFGFGSDYRGGEGISALIIKN